MARITISILFLAFWINAESQIFFGQNTGNSYGDQGLYTEAQLDDMIYNNGYIPVASASELNNIRNSVTAWMGAGTKYYNSYSIGLKSNKYIQVKTINLNNLEFTPIGIVSTPFNSIYDGNELNILNLHITEDQEYCGLFGYCTSTLKNIKISGYISVTTDYCGLICGTSLVIDNCQGTGNVTGNDYVGGLIGISSAIINSSFTGSVTGNDAVGGISGTTHGNVTNSNSNATVTAVNYSGGLLGTMVGATITIYGSHSQGVVNSTGNYSGGIIGNNQGTIINCYSSSLINASGLYIGGFVGLNQNNIDKCFSTGNVNISSFNSYVGAFCGIIYDACISNSYCLGACNNGGGFVGLINNVLSEITNCFSTGISYANAGFASGNVGGTINSSYWDITTSGQSGSMAGVGKTTTQLKADAIGSGIYLNWSTSIWAKTTGYPYLIDNN